MSAPLSSATTHVSSDTRPREGHVESFQVIEFDDGTVRAADEKRRRAVGGVSQVEPTVGTSSPSEDPPEREASPPKSTYRRPDVPAPPSTVPGIPAWIIPVIACLCYSFTSMTTTLSNKAIINFYDFDFPLFLTVFQNGFVALCVLLLSNWGVINVEPLEESKVKTWLPLNVAFVLMLVFSQLALGRISVAMVTVFKNFTTISIALGDRIFFDNPISLPIVGALTVMATGSIVAGYNDLEFRLDGYIFIFLNCASQATYILYMNKVMRVLKLDKWSSMYYNNVISIPLLIPCFFVFKELDQVFISPAWSLPSFWSLLIINGACSLGISLCSFWAMAATSPTTYSMVGSFTKIPLTIIGSLLFKTPFTFMGRMSTMVGLGGGLLYTWAKTRQQNEKKKLAEKQAATKS